MAGGRRPFSAGDVALGLHVPEGAVAHDMIEAIVGQAVAAEEAGFAGVSVSEHHRAFPGYMGQPIIACHALLARTTRVWAAACPTVLSLWPPALLAEQVAWTAAVHPGRFGVGVAAGYVRADFDAVDVDFEGRVDRFDHALGQLTRALSADGPLADDPAIVAWQASSVPVLCAAKSRTAAQRAARHGLGVIVSGHAPPDATRAVVDAYRDAGGEAPVMIVSRVWVGTVPKDAVGAIESLYATAGPSGRPVAGNARPPVLAGGADDLVEHLVADREALGATCLNLRVHLPSVPAAVLLEQIARLGADVLPRLGLTRPDVHRPEGSLA